MPWNMSNPLYRWKMKHGKLNKSVKRKRTQRQVNIMPRRRRRNRVRRALRRYSPGRAYRRFRRGKQPLPLLPIVTGVVAPMWDSFERAGGQAALISNPIEFGTGLVDQISQHYTGFSPFAAKYGHEQWQPWYLLNTYGGLIMGIIGHKLANKFGVNRYMRKIPFLGKYVQI